MPHMQIMEAVYENGVLKPVDKVELMEHQRVCLIVQPLNGLGLTQAAARAAALVRVRETVEKMNFRLQGPLPSRDELHERD